MISESIQFSQTVSTHEIERRLKEETEMHPLDLTIALAYSLVLRDCELHCFHEGVEVKNLGGLHVIGTSLHESRRIDNQVGGTFCTKSV